MNEFEFDEGVDEEMYEEACSTAIYSLFALLHFPPLINPLGDADSYLFSGLMGHVPHAYFEICDEQQDKIYNALFNMTKNMSVLERKYFLTVLSCNIDYKLCKPEVICTFLTGSLSLDARREMCKHAFNKEFLSEYLERVDGAILVRESVWSALFGKEGACLYEGVKKYGEKQAFIYCP